MTQDQEADRRSRHILFIGGEPGSSLLGREGDLSVSQLATDQDRHCQMREQLIGLGMIRRRAWSGQRGETVWSAAWPPARRSVQTLSRLCSGLLPALACSTAWPRGRSLVRTVSLAC